VPSAGMPNALLLGRSSKMQLIWSRLANQIVFVILFF